jgi:hypothetical protein
LLLLLLCLLAVGVTADNCYLYPVNDLGLDNPGHFEEVYWANYLSCIYDDQIRPRLPGSGCNWVTWELPLAQPVQVKDFNLLQYSAYMVGTDNFKVEVGLELTEFPGPGVYNLMSSYAGDNNSSELRQVDLSYLPQDLWINSIVFNLILDVGWWDFPQCKDVACYFHMGTVRLAKEGCEIDPTPTVTVTPSPTLALPRTSTPTATSTLLPVPTVLPTPTVTPNPDMCPDGINREFRTYEFETTWEGWSDYYGFATWSPDKLLSVYYAPGNKSYLQAYVQAEKDILSFSYTLNNGGGSNPVVTNWFSPSLSWSPATVLVAGTNFVPQGQYWAFAAVRDGAVQYALENIRLRYRCPAVTPTVTTTPGTGTPGTGTPTPGTGTPGTGTPTPGTGTTTPGTGTPGTGTPVPSTGTPVPSTGTSVPSTGTPVPSTGTPGTGTPVLTPVPGVFGDIGTPLPGATSTRLPAKPSHYATAVYRPVGGEQDIPLGHLRPVPMGTVCIGVGPYTFFGATWGFRVCLQQWRVSVGLFGQNFYSDVLAYLLMGGVIFWWVKR